MMTKLFPRLVYALGKFTLKKLFLMNSAEIRCKALMSSTKIQCGRFEKTYLFCGGFLHVKT